MREPMNEFTCNELQSYTYDNLNELFSKLILFLYLMKENL